MQRSGGVVFLGEIIVNCRRPLIPNVIRLNHAHDANKLANCGAIIGSLASRKNRNGLSLVAAFS